jgi:hypothetical protein
MEIELPPHQMNAINEWMVKILKASWFDLAR